MFIIAPEDTGSKLLVKNTERLGERRESMRVSPPTIESDVRLILEAMFQAALASEHVTLRTRPMEGGGVTVEFASSRQGTASLNVSVENSDPTIYLIVGSVTPFGFWLNGSWSEDRPAVEEFIATIRAVAEGRLEETLWVQQGAIVRSYAKLKLALPSGEKVVDMPYWRVGYNLFRRPAKRDVHYAPWDTEINEVHLDPP